MPLRQLESEIIRDSVLVASGQLNRSFAGPAIMTVSQGDGTVVIDNEALVMMTSGKIFPGRPTCTRPSCISLDSSVTRTRVVRQLIDV